MRIEYQCIGDGHLPFKPEIGVVEGEVKLGLSQGTQESNTYVPGFVEIEDDTSRLRVGADFLSAN